MPNNLQNTIPNETGLEKRAKHHRLATVLPQKFE